LFRRGIKGVAVGKGGSRSCLVELYSHVIRKDGWMADRRTYGQMAERILGLNIGCCTKEKRNVGFRCSEGPLNRESGNFNL
jgi:hypothetical protein